MKIFRFIKICSVIITSFVVIAYVSMFLNRANFDLLQEFHYVYRIYFILSLYYLFIMISVIVVTVLKPKGTMGVLFQVSTIIASFVGLYILYTKIPSSWSYTTIPENYYLGDVNYPINFLIPSSKDFVELYSDGISLLAGFLYNYKGITYLLFLSYTIVASLLYERKVIMIISSSVVAIAILGYILTLIINAWFV